MITSNAEAQCWKQRLTDWIPGECFAFLVDRDDGSFDGELNGGRASEVVYGKVIAVDEDAVHGLVSTGVASSFSPGSGLVFFQPSYAIEGRWFAESADATRHGEEIGQLLPITRDIHGRAERAGFPIALAWLDELVPLGHGVLRSSIEEHS